MSTVFKWIFAVQILALAFVSASAQLPNCPLRPDPGSVVLDPLSLSSQNGTLSLGLTMRNAADAFGVMHYCFDYPTPTGLVEAPTLRLNPGDTLSIDFTNQLNVSSPAAAADHAHMHDMAMSVASAIDPCNNTIMTANTTNIHFHGLNVPPVCHQDDVINTLIQPSTTPFHYSVQIPANEPPGLYWYHPHPHGMTTVQVNGGASGAIIIGGIEKIKPQVTGLTERVLFVREQSPPGSSEESGAQLTLNFQTAISPKAASPIIQMKPNEKQFWRVANTTANTFLALQLLFGTTAQTVELISLDGVPVTGDPMLTAVNLPPAGRAEFIVTGPPTGTTATFVNAGFDTGPVGDPAPYQALADVVATGSPAQASKPVPPGVLPSVTQRFSGLAAMTPTTKRRLYFSEAYSSTADQPNFFLTVDGQTPKLFKMNVPPAIVTKVGSVEDWTIENRTSEVHAFHMHQIHFLVVAVDGKPVQNPTLQDTYMVPYWTGTGPYHNVTLRMDFRDANIAGTFLYHCHILDHEDGGMMEKIQVNP